MEDLLAKKGAQEGERLYDMIDMEAYGVVPKELLDAERERAERLEEENEALREDLELEKKRFAALQYSYDNLAAHPQARSEDE